MSVLLSIGLYSEHDRVSDIVASLYAQMLTKGEFWRARIVEYELDAGLPLEKMTPNELRVIAEEILKSSKMLALEISTDFHYGDMAVPTIEVYGVGFWDGNYVLQGGPVRLTCTYRELLPPLPPRGGDREHDGSSTEELDKLSRTAHTTVTENIEHLFMDACDLSEGRSTNACGQIEHGAMFQGGEYLSPVACLALFHRDVREYAHDFTRIYLQYRRGVSITQTLKKSEDLWKIRAPKPDHRWRIGIPGKLFPDTYTILFDLEDPDRDRELLQFLDSLTADKAKKLALLSDREIRELLTQMNSDLGTEGQHNSKLYSEDNRVTVRDFGDCGLALYSPPLSTIWYAYKYIADNAL